MSYTPIKKSYRQEYGMKIDECNGCLIERKYGSGEVIKK